MNKEIILYGILAIALFAGIAYSASAQTTPQYIEIAKQIQKQEFCTDLFNAGGDSLTAQCWFTKDIDKRCSMESSYLCANYEAWKIWKGRP